MDLGCGDGTIIMQLLGYGLELYAYDLPRRGDILKQRLETYFGDGFSEHVRIAQDERKIPFDDSSFDVVYANQVFEHVRFLDCLVGEVARVLRPDGVLLANFPIATYPLEGHLGIPFAHWLPPGMWRRRYLCAFYALHIRPPQPGLTAWESAIAGDDYLREYTFYRFMNELRSVFSYYFRDVCVETERLLEAKADLLALGKRPWQRLFATAVRSLAVPERSAVVTHFYNACFCMSGPRTPTQHPGDQRI
jgi:SAM-dependent methyltransferase